MFTQLAKVPNFFGVLFTKYPKELGVSPKAFDGLVKSSCMPNGTTQRTLAVQLVQDKFYFLLFGAISSILHLRTELVVVMGANAAVGAGWMSEFKRTAPLTWLRNQSWVRAYGEIADGVAYRCATWAHPLRNLADWIKSNSLWRQMQSHGGAHSLFINGIQTADLIIDSYLRLRPSPEFNVNDPFVRRLIWQALRDVRQAQVYFGRVRPRLYLTSYTTYLEHGIPARVALHQGVDVWSFGNLNSFAKRLSLGDSYHTQDFSAYRKTFEGLDHHEERLQEARRQLENRLAGGIDAATSYMRRSAYGDSVEPAPSGLNGAVVVFLHDFYDSPHVYPELVFEDFWQWICFTIETLRAQDVKFFLKPHPNQIELSDEALGLLRKQYPELRWVSSNITNVQLAQEGIACGVTVYGTVAHELAYLGVPSIGSARHPHHSFDFCRTARTRDEYESMLKTYSVLPVPKEEMRRQALAFYYMHNLYGDEDQHVLRNAFVEFWKACNVGECTEESVMGSFRRLVELPAFDGFVKRLTNI